jgi:hypothetical protein
MSGEWLRETLDPRPVPPPDLADRAVRTARRIVRRRVAAGALAAAALAAVAVPLAARGDGADRTAGPVPTVEPSTPCSLAYGSKLTITLDPARSARDVAWPYRGDTDLRPAVTALGRGLTDVRPLFGTRLPDGTGDVLMVAGRSAAGWRLRTDAAGARAERALPVLGPATQLSVVAGRFVVIVAAPGSRSVQYTYCRPDGPLSFFVEGDTFVQQAAPRGAIEVTGRDGTVATLGAPGE